MAYVISRELYKEMVARCHNPKHRLYKWYGGRGIAVCSRWRFGENGYSGRQCFEIDMAPRPDGLTLDRTDNDKGYSKSNCAWRTHAEQQKNRSDNHHVLYEGTSMILADAIRLSGSIVDAGTISYRLKKGMPLEAALLTPVMAKADAGRVSGKVRRGCS